MTESNPPHPSIHHRRLFLRTLAGATGAVFFGAPAAMADGNLGRSLLLLGPNDGDSEGPPGEGQDGWCTIVETETKSYTGLLPTGTVTGVLYDPANTLGPGTWTAATVLDDYTSETDAWSYTWLYNGTPITVFLSYTNRASLTASAAKVRTYSSNGDAGEGFFTYTQSFSNGGQVRSYTELYSKTAWVPCKDNEPGPLASGLPADQGLSLGRVEPPRDLLDPEARFSAGHRLNI